MNTRNLEVHHLSCKSLQADNVVTDLSNTKDNSNNVISGKGTSIALPAESESIVIGTNCLNTSQQESLNVVNQYNLFYGNYGGVYRLSVTGNSIGQQNINIGRNNSQSHSQGVIIGAECSSFNGIGSKLTMTARNTNRGMLIGHNSYSYLSRSVCIGQNQYVNRYDSVLIGNNNSAYRMQQAIGYGANFIEDNSGMAIGTNATGKRGTTIIGKDSSASNNYSVVVGSYSSARKRGVAMGHFAVNSTSYGGLVFNVSGQAAGTADGWFDSEMTVTENGSLSYNGNTNVTVSNNVAGYMNLTIQGVDYKVPLYI